jgi:hypothetical protein
MTKKYDAVATIGEYTTKTGEKKKRYLTVGAVFEDDEGRLSLKLDGIPVSPDWSGWISFYQPKEATQEPRSPKKRDFPKADLMSGESEEIPF